MRLHNPKNYYLSLRLASDLLLFSLFVYRSACDLCMDIDHIYGSVRNCSFQVQLLPQQILIREQRHQSAESFFLFFFAEVGHTLDLASAIITVTALMSSDGGL